MKSNKNAFAKVDKIINAEDEEKEILTNFERDYDVLTNKLRRKIPKGLTRNEKYRWAIQKMHFHNKREELVAQKKQAVRLTVLRRKKAEQAYANGHFDDEEYVPGPEEMEEQDN